MERRVVVTGMGAITPIGNNIEDFWNGIKAGKIGFGKISTFDTSKLLGYTEKIRLFNRQNRCANCALVRPVFSRLPTRLNNIKEVPNL